jgi:hypothetical protein
MLLLRQPNSVISDAQTPVLGEGFERLDVCLRAIQAMPSACEAAAAGGTMEIKHVCQSCGEIMAVHEHSNYQEVKDCLRGMKPLCGECASWPGCPLPTGSRGQEGLTRG